jgi:hypothetical protein
MYERSDLEVLGQLGHSSSRRRAVRHAGAAAGELGSWSCQGAAGGLLLVGHAALCIGHLRVVKADDGANQRLKLEQQDKGRQDAHGSTIISGAGENKLRLG